MTQPVDTLFVSTSLNHGGAQRFTSNLLAHLDRKRVRPALCLLRDDIGFPLADDVALTKLNYRNPLYLFKTVKQLRQLIEQTAPAVVVSNVSATSVVVGLALRSMKGPKPVWIARVGSDPAQHVKRVRRWFLNRVYPNVDQFVVNSRGLIDAMCAIWPFAKNRIKVIYNPTDFARLDELASAPIEATDAELNAGDSRPLIVAIGRLIDAKRYDVMFEALQLVIEKRDVRLWIFGDGVLRLPLQKRVARRGLQDHVQFWGHIANPFALASQASLFCMSSIYEGLPNSLIETQGLGIPAVSTRCPYGPDEIIVDGSTGILVPVNDPAALAAAMLCILDDADLRTRMGEAARTSARERFDALKLSREWENTITECVQPADSTTIQ